jgi:hypothetical protein
MEKYAFTVTRACAVVGVAPESAVCSTRKSARNARGRNALAQPAPQERRLATSSRQAGTFAPGDGGRRWRYTSCHPVLPRRLAPMRATGRQAPAHRPFT